MHQQRPLAYALQRGGGGDIWSIRHNMGESFSDAAMVALEVETARLLSREWPLVLRVADAQYRLEEGQFLLWDDTFEHEAWNESDEVRIVLSLDVWRRGMPVDMRILSAALIRLVRLGIRIRGVG